MRHDQENEDMNYRDRDRYNERRYRPNPEHLQNARNRWGDPDPRMGPHSDDWRRFEDERQRNTFNRSDWRPFEQRDNRHFQENRGEYDHRDERRRWQQHDDRFRAKNQHAEDRWSQDREMPQQHHHPRHASERFYREQRRRD